MQSKIGKVSALMFLLDWIGKRTDEKIINFSIKKARDQSWKIANEFWALGGFEKINRVNQVDESIKSIGEFIKNPKSGFLAFILKFISRFEEKNIETIIKKLKE